MSKTVKRYLAAWKKKGYSVKTKKSFFSGKTLYSVSGMTRGYVGESDFIAGSKIALSKLSNPKYGVKKNPTRKKKLSATEKRSRAIAAFDAGNSFFKPETIAKMRRAEDRASKKTTAKKNPTRKTKKKTIQNKRKWELRYASGAKVTVRADDYEGALERGREISPRLKPRDVVLIEEAKKNPIPHYIIRAKVKNRDTSFYYDGSRLVASKPQAKKFSDLRDAKRWGEKVWQMFPSIATVGVLKA